MTDRLAELDLAAAFRAILRNPLVRAEVIAIVRETVPAPGAASPLLSTDDVRQRLGLKDCGTVLAYIRTGRLRATRAPGAKEWRVREEDLEAFLAGESTPPKPLLLDDERTRRAASLAAAVTKRTNGGRE